LDAVTAEAHDDEVTLVHHPGTEGLAVVIHLAEQQVELRFDAILVRPVAAAVGLVVQEENLFLWEAAVEQAVAQGAHVPAAGLEFADEGVVVDADEHGPFLTVAADTVDVPLAVLGLQPGGPDGKGKKQGDGDEREAAHEAHLRRSLERVQTSWLV